MQPILNRQQARELDRRAQEEYGVPSIVLMENAGRGVADKLCLLGVSGPVVICCGPGNNGGDGFVIARHLDLRGHAVHVLVWADPARLTGDAATNFRVLQSAGIPCDIMPTAEVASRVIGGANWIVDALLGTGARGEPRAPLDQVIDQLNAAARPLLAVDVPSGLDCDTGQAARHTIRAAHTCTFVATKPGFLAPGAEHYTGTVHVLDIGAPRRLVDAMVSGRDANPETPNGAGVMDRTEE